MRTIRTIVLAGTLAALAAAGPAAWGDPVDVEVGSTPVCVVDTGENDGCTVPAEVPGVAVTIDHEASPVECVAVIADCPTP